jgi:adenylate cyclase
VEKERVQRRLAAILAADVAGYSRLTGVDEEGTIAWLRALRRELIDPAIAEHRGRIVKTTGDGILIEFASVVDAVRCAVEVQRGMASRSSDLPSDKRIDFRMGIHLGDVVVEGDDLLGDGVNLAARLEGIAEPGGICLSEDAYRQMGTRVAAKFVDTGWRSLKNIDQAVRVYSIVAGTGLLDSERRAEDAAVPLLSFLVLPFTNLSDNKEDEFFADGITDDLTTDLSQWKDSFVIAHSTALAYKRKAVDAKAVGRELRVAYVLEGSVRRVNNRVRVGARLIETQSGGHVWSDRFDRELSGLLELQDEITGRIALALHYKITDVESRRAWDRRSNDPDARDLVARGNATMYKPTSKATMEQARGFFERALKIDDQNVRAWAGVALAHAADVLGRWSEAPLEQVRAAEQAAARALECDPMRPEAHLARAAVLFAQRRLEAALEEYGTVTDLRRGWPTAYARMGILNALLGRPAETIPLVERAIRLSPRDANLGEWYLHIGIASFMLDQLGEAILWLRRSTEANPELGINYYVLASACSLDGRQEEAHAALSEYRRVDPSMTISKLRASPFSGHPAYLAWRERFYEGLRKAGMPEE